MTNKNKSKAKVKVESRASQSVPSQEVHSALSHRLVAISSKLVRVIWPDGKFCQVGLILLGLLAFWIIAVSWVEDPYPQPVVAGEVAFALTNSATPIAFDGELSARVTDLRLSSGEVLKLPPSPFGIQIRPKHGCDRPWFHVVASQHGQGAKGGPALLKLFVLDGSHRDCSFALNLVAGPNVSSAANQQFDVKGTVTLALSGSVSLLEDASVRAVKGRRAGPASLSVAGKYLGPERQGDTFETDSEPLVLKRVGVSVDYSTSRAVLEVQLGEDEDTDRLRQRWLWRCRKVVHLSKTGLELLKSFKDLLW